jgi:hypothetical protein
MSEEKKYSAKEAAIAVLKKAEEVLKKSEALKKASAFSDSNGPAPKGEIHPKEKVQGESANPGDRVEGQAAPDKNPKEEAEGNNELAGTTPTQVGQDGKNVPGHGEIVSGHFKLAKFIGRMHAKRKTPPGAM